MAKWRLPEFLNSLTSPDQASEELATDGAEKVEYDGDPKLADRPLDRSILWLPGGWGEFQRGPPRKHELFVEQEVLRRVDSHANERIEGAYGLLIGNVRVCRKTRVPFIHAEGVHRSDRPLPVDNDLSSFREFFWEVREKAGRSGQIIVGWYHTHNLLGLQLSERDRRLHMSQFHDDWPCALVVVSREGGTEGGFFQRDRGETLFRRAARPFREIINQRVKPGGGPYATTLSWTNYWTEEPVLYVHTPGDRSAVRTGWKSLQERRQRVESGEERTQAELTRSRLARSRREDKGATEADAADPGPRREPVGSAPEPAPEPPPGKPRRVDHAPRMPPTHGDSTPGSSAAAASRAWEEWRKTREARGGIEEARRRRAQAVERAAMEAAKAIVEQAQGSASEAADEVPSDDVTMEAGRAAEVVEGAEAAKARAEAREAEEAAARAEAEAKARAEEETRARAEAREAEAEAAKAEAVAEARAQEEARARADAEAKEAAAARAEAEAKARAEEETRARAEAEARAAEAAKAEAVLKARAEEEARSEAEAEAKKAEAARAEAEEKARREEEARAAAEAAREAAEAAKAEAVLKARAEEHARSEAEAEAKEAGAARAEAEEKARREEEARAAAEAAREAAEAARAAAEKRTEEEVRKRAEAERRAAEARAEVEATKVASAAWVEPAAAEPATEPATAEPESPPSPAEERYFEEEGGLETPLFVLPEGEPFQVRIRTWIPWMVIGLAAVALAAWLVFG